MTGVAAAAARAGNQPEATFRALEKLVQDTIGVKLFTLMEVDLARNMAWRSYSNMPQAYPTLGEKPRVQNRWSDIVDGRHQTFVANTIEEIAVVDNYSTRSRATNTRRKPLIADRKKLYIA